MERTQKAAVLAADVGWSDVGQWSNVWRLSPQDASGNSLPGRVVAIDSSNVLVRSDQHLAAVIGLDNVIVVSTETPSWSPTSRSRTRSSSLSNG
jgi:mannose-1-phosphate guanylyltransferase/mannose-6-phosphate isomerase